MSKENHPKPHPECGYVLYRLMAHINGIAHTMYISEHHLDFEAKVEHMYDYVGKEDGIPIFKKKQL